MIEIEIFNKKDLKYFLKKEPLATLAPLLEDSLPSYNCTRHINQIRLNDKYNSQVDLAPSRHLRQTRGT